jgi:O-antigen ligase
MDNPPRRHVAADPIAERTRHPEATERTRLWPMLWSTRFAPVLFGLAVCAVPLSIAVAESLLGGALLFFLVALTQRRAKVWFPRVFWYWLPWAGLEVFVWLRSGALRVGLGEIRHLFLIAAVFLLVPTLNRAGERIAVWCGVILSATVSSIFLIGHFVFQLLFYRGKLDPVVYLRNGGLLHHWMIYGIVETLAFAGLLELWHYFPEKRRWLLPVSAINTVAILLSLTRMVWICTLLLLILHLFWCRSRWIWAVPVLPCVLFLVSPSAVRLRVTESLDPDYYSNAERVQMLRVGWEMIRRYPLTGVGPGRVDALYTSFLRPAEPVPAYHGHLHNNLLQLGAEFGLPVTAAALLFVIVLFRDLLTQWRLARDRDRQFLCRSSLLALTGFLVAGLFDYTYGHSLGLILLGFAVLSPLTPSAVCASEGSNA